MTKPSNIPSLYYALQDRFEGKLKSIEMAKASLVDISHLIENIVLNNKLKALVLTGFQESNYWQQEAAHYLQLAGVINRACAFAQGTLPTEDSKNIYVRLENNDPLRQEWFLIVLTEQFGCLLCGLDNNQPFQSEAERLFDTFFSFDPNHVSLALDVLEEALAVRNPTKLDELKNLRQSFNLSLPDPHYFNLIMNKIVEHLIHYQEVAKQLAEERATRAAVSEFLHQASQPLTSAVLTMDVMKLSKNISQDDLDFLYSAIEDLKLRLTQIRATFNKSKINPFGKFFGDNEKSVIRE